MNDLQALYQQLILEHSKERHGCAELPGWDSSSHQVNPVCGDEITLQAQVENDRLHAVIWQGSGCAISQASVSMMTDLVSGLSVEEITALGEDFQTMMHSQGKELPDELLDRLEDSASLQGVSQYVNRIKCAMLGWMALKEAIAKACEKKG